MLWTKVFGNNVHFRYINSLTGELKMTLIGCLYTYVFDRTHYGITEWGWRRAREEV